MTLSKREKGLAVAVGVFAGGLVLWFGYSLLGGLFGLNDLRTQIAVQTDKLEKLQDQAIRAKKMQDQVAQWNRQALPSDVSRAGSLYQNWLLELAGKAGFRQQKVEPGEVRSRSDTCQVLPFTVRGQASLEQLVTFLYEFYAAGHLHQVRRLTIRPVEKTKDLDLMIMIEALSLPTADRKDQLSQTPSNRLALASVEQYRKAIVDRNVLSPPRPVEIKPTKPVERDDKPEPFDASRFAYVTGIVEVNGEPQVWVKARTTDEKFQLRQGEKFQMGPFSATIARIEPRNVEIEIDGKRHSIPLGSSVRGEADAKQAEGKGPKPEPGGPEGGPKGPKPEAVVPPDAKGSGPMFRGPPTGNEPGPGRAVSKRERRRAKAENGGEKASGEGR